MTIVSHFIPPQSRSAAPDRRRTLRRGVLIVAATAAIGLAGDLGVMAVAWAVLALQAGLSFVQVFPIGRARPLRRAGSGGRTVFSVHLAAHSEPPDIVILTLKGLLAQRDGPEFEVIVLDNNTADPALWRPVAAFCRKHGGRLRFERRMGVRGAKAGALSIARELTRPDATHVVTIDADYVVEPDFLSRAERALRETGADFLQFPQAYCQSQSAPDVADELQDFFGRFAHRGGECGASLLTGTLSVISLDALDAVGGWRSDTVTEDAELGVRLIAAGAEGRFLPYVAGRGLLPLSAGCLAKQRRRWAHGNAATLLRHVASVNLSTLRQLVAWLNLIVPGAVLMLLGLLAMTLGAAPGGLLATAGAGTIALALLSTLAPVASKGAGAVGARLALLPSSAFATVRALLGLPETFRRTEKSFANADSIPLETGLFVLAGLTGLALSAATGRWLEAVSATALVLTGPTFLLLENSLRNYREKIAEVPA